MGNLNNSSSSQKKSRTYCEINAQKQLYRRQLNSSFTENSSSIIEPSSVCQLSNDDSLMQHLQDIISEPERTMNLPLQRSSGSEFSKQQVETQQTTNDDDNVRLQTITEEQLSTNRVSQEDERGLL